MSKVFLSPPHMSGQERRFVGDRVRQQLHRPARTHGRCVRARIRRLHWVALRAGAQQRHSGDAPGLAASGRGTRRRGDRLDSHLHRQRNAGDLRGRVPGVRRCGSGHLEHGPRSAGRGTRRVPKGGARSQGRDSHRPLRPVLRPGPHPGSLRPLRDARDYGLGRGGRGHLQGQACRCRFAGGRLFVQREQDHHDLWRRHAGLRGPRPHRAGAVPFSAGPRPRSPLPALPDRLQLSDEQHPGGHRSRAARGFGRAGGRATDPCSRTGRLLGICRGSNSCRKPPTEGLPAGSP